MIKKTFFTVSGIAVLFLFSINCFGFDFNPGQYAVTSKVKMPGMPGGLAPQTITQCMTNQDPVPKSNSSGQDCKINNMEQNGNIVTWDMECLQQGQKITSQGEMVYSGDSFDGTITTKMGPQAGNMVITTEITGKRIGDCQNSE